MLLTLEDERSRWLDIPALKNGEPNNSAARLTAASEDNVYHARGNNPLSVDVSRSLACLLYADHFPKSVIVLTAQTGGELLTNGLLH
jgi:hypothetical protein